MIFFFFMPYMRNALFLSILLKTHRQSLKFSSEDRGR